MSRTGFTLVEILVVLMIVVVLGGLIYPVLGVAKRGSLGAVSVSNLHQVWLSLAIYEQNSGDYPLAISAEQVASAAPTWDVLDTWRRDSSVRLGDPFLGSYAYSGNDPLFLSDPKGWPSYLAASDDPALLVSIFSSDHPIRRFSGEVPSASSCTPALVCVMPSPVIVAWRSGTVKSKNLGMYSNGFRTAPIITWSSLFYLSSHE